MSFSHFEVCGLCHKATPCEHSPRFHLFTEDPSGVCENCGKRPATSRWVGAASTMDLVHGSPTHWWCDVCCLVAQIQHGEQEAERLEKELPELKKKLQEQLSSEPEVSS